MQRTAVVLSALGTVVEIRELESGGKPPRVTIDGTEYDRVPLDSAIEDDPGAGYQLVYVERGVDPARAEALAMQTLDRTPPRPPDRH